MDWIVTPYTAQIRYSSDPKRIGTVVWFRAAPGAKQFQGPRFLASNIWEDIEESPGDLLGEVWGTHRNGTWQNPGLAGDHFEGPLEWFATGVPVGNSAPPSRCGGAILKPLARLALSAGERVPHNQRTSRAQLALSASSSVAPRSRRSTARLAVCATSRLSSHQRGSMAKLFFLGGARAPIFSRAALALSALANERPTSRSSSAPLAMSAVTGSSQTPKYSLARLALSASSARSSRSIVSRAPLALSASSNLSARSRMGTAVLFFGSARYVPPRAVVSRAPLAVSATSSKPGSSQHSHAYLAMQATSLTPPILPPNLIDGSLCRWGDPRLLPLGALASYPDRSMTGSVFTATGAMMPAVVSAGLDGQQCIDLDGVNQWMTNSNLAIVFNGLNKPFHKAMVFKFSAVPTSDHPYGFWIHCNLHSGTYLVTRDAYADCFTGQYDCDCRSNAGGDEQTVVGGNGYDTAKHVIQWDFDGALLRILLDGQLIGQGPYTCGTMTADSYNYFAHARIDGVSDLAFMRVGEDVIYNASLWPTKSGQVWDYLSSQWHVPLGPAPTWTPFDLASPRSWHNENSWNVPPDLYAVTTWNDRVIRPGNSSYIYHGSGTYHVALRNGMPGVVMNGTSDYWGGDGIASDSLSGTDKQYTYALAFRCTDTSSTPVLRSVGSSTSNTPVQNLYLNPSSGPYEFLRRDNSGGLKDLTGGATDTTVHVLVERYDGTHLNAYLDGVQIITNGDLATSAFTVDRFTLAALRRAAAEAFCACELYEDVFSDVDEGATQAGNLYTYLSRWL